jgi:hypothetical protein
MMDADEIARLREIAQKATPGPWAAGCLADDAHPCNCRSVLCESSMGAIATVQVNNGLSISEGGNDAPPIEEARANLRYIAAFDPPTTRALLDALDSLVEEVRKLTEQCNQNADAAALAWKETEAMRDEITRINLEAIEKRQRDLAERGAEAMRAKDGK